MENKWDVKAIQQQLNLLMENNQRSKDYLSAIQLLMVDDNNGTLKDSSLATNFNNLSTKINHLSEEIEQLISNVNK